MQPENDVPDTNPLDLQPAINRIRWEEVLNIVENHGKRDTSKEKIDIIGMYSLGTITVLIAGILAYYGILEGQAIAGFLGAVIGYLLSTN